MDTRTARAILGCGCFPGEEECLDAKRLKLEVERARGLVQEGKAEAAFYEAAREAYEQHKLNGWRAAVS